MAANSENAITLVASWVNLSFYILEIILAIKYFHRPNRPLWNKIGVGALIFSDTVCTVGICWQTYVELLLYPCIGLTGAGFRNSLYWPIAVTLLSTYMAASIEQGFLCSLFYSLSKQRIITGFLVVSIFLHLGFSWASAALVLKHRTPNGKSITATQIGAISCAVTDFLIAVALSGTFYRMDAGAIKGRWTHNLLRRLGALSLTSGCIVASTTLIAVVTLLKGNNVYIIFFFLQGRMYAVSVLGSFLSGFAWSKVEPNQDALKQRGSSSCIDNITGVVFHVDYGRSTPRLDSLHLEELSSENLKSHPDPD
ncbi:hypothetical protein R3P38DRAFT_2959899 [Favolaschia claudopus]|uniref:DUF6534 domain-containing protein n=1 Tax=Favolaschia claudopus TaxID=2862362 RepID=A0AAW0B9D0_9AGAR